MSCKFIYCFCLLLFFVENVSSAQTNAFIRVSPRDPRYFEYSDGRPYIPIGLNMIGMGDASTETGLAQMNEWMENLAVNKGNFVRLWLSNNFWDIEHEK